MGTKKYIQQGVKKNSPAKTLLTTPKTPETTPHKFILRQCAIMFRRDEYFKKKSNFTQLHVYQQINKHLNLNKHLSKFLFLRGEKWFCFQSVNILCIALQTHKKSLKILNKFLKKKKKLDFKLDDVIFWGEKNIYNKGQKKLP